MVKIDRLATEHFDNPRQFGRAMELLAESTRADRISRSFREYEESFLLKLDERDDSLLSSAYSLRDQFERESQTLGDKAIVSPELLDALLARINSGRNDIVPDSKNPTLDELFENWKTVNKDSGSKINTFSPSIELFVRFINNLSGKPVRIIDLDIEHIHGYQEMYKNLPVGTQVKDTSITDLLKLKGKSKSPKTIKDNFSHINTFLSWIQARGYPINANLITVMSKGSDVKISVKDKKQRVDLTDDDLNKFFGSKEYTETGKFSTSAMYWAPIIALFTGARLMEILQLEKHDIKKEDGIWVFDFDDLNTQSEDELKRLKNGSSRRQVPIHTEILKLGFVDYVDSCSGRLFPDEERNVHGKFDRFQKRQGNYRKKVGVVPAHEKELRDFHSFRHTVETRLTEIRSIGPRSGHFDTGIIDGILGHASKGRSTGQSTYNHSQYVTAKSNALKRLKYDSVDFSNIVDWRKCKFCRKPYQEQMRSKLDQS